jgi:2-phosphoglycerate kinase
MSVALDQGILKCISTDTVRAVMRSFIPADISPDLHRSSYAPASEDEDDPVRSWRETCTVLEASVQELVTDSISRGQGLVLEGMSITPSKKLIKIWEEAGGVLATGYLLTVCKEETHKLLL